MTAERLVEMVERATPGDPRYDLCSCGKSKTIQSQRCWSCYVANGRNGDPKDTAHNVVERAVNRGELVRPDSCPECGSGGRIEGHHADYDRPLDVEWLCQACHSQKHGPRGVAAEAAARTHCPRGHAYDAANTRVHKGKRYCRACQRERWHERKALA